MIFTVEMKEPAARWFQGKCLNDKDKVDPDAQPAQLNKNFNSKLHCLDMCRSQSFTGCQWSEDGSCTIYKRPVFNADHQAGHHCFIPSKTS